MTNQQKNKVIEYEGVTLHLGQQRILKEIINSSAKYHVINASRQWGKSVFASQLILSFAINNVNVRCMYATPIHAQAKKVYIKILNAIIDSGVVKEHNKSDMTITLINNSVMIFTGTEKFDNLRGDTIRFMICDEFSYMRDEAFKTALKPMLLSQKNAKCVIISTPKGKKNHFFNMAQMGKSIDQVNYSYHEGNYLENKYYDFAEIEDARLTLPSYIFRQEYQNEFIDNGQEIFTNIDQIFIQTIYAKPTTRNYGGLDLGRQEDYTVLTIMNENGEIVHQYRDRQKSWEIIINNIVDILKRYNATCLVEVNNIGDVIFELLQKKYAKVEAFQTTNSSKQFIIELLAVEFQNRTIKLPTPQLNSVMYDELLSLEFEYNIKTRNVFYHAPQGLHDDTVISLALSNQCRRDKLNKGTYMIRG